MSHNTPSRATSRHNTIIWGSLCTILGIGTLATFFIKETAVSEFWSPITLFKLALYIGFLIIVFKLVRGTPQLSSKYTSLPAGVQRLVIILPILAIVFAVINAAFPEVSWLVRMSDDDIFQRPGALARAIFELVACGYFLSLIPHALKRRQLLLTGTVILIGAVLFVMGMEEISWGQRIFEWKTTGYFASHNVQGETNLHNLATQLFQNVLFFGGFLLLVALPFLHDKLANLLHKAKKFRYLINFLPEPWMIFAFGAGLLFVDPFIAIYGIHWDSILFQIVATLAILGVLTVRLYKSGSELYRLGSITLGSGIIVLILSLTFGDLWSHYNQGLPTEYLKLYIIFGILCWAASVRRRVKTA